MRSRSHPLAPRMSSAFCGAVRSAGSPLFPRIDSAAARNQPSNSRLARMTDTGSPNPADRARAKSRGVIVAVEKDENSSVWAHFECCELDRALQFSRPVHQTSSRSSDRLDDLEDHTGIDLMANSPKQDRSRFDFTVTLNYKAEFQWRHRPSASKRGSDLAPPKSLDSGAAGRSWSSRSNSPGV